MVADRYYYQCLNDVEKRVYQTVYAGIKQQKSLIPITVSGLAKESVNRIFHAVTADNPLFYYCNHSVMSIAQDQFGNMAFCPQYYFKEDQVFEHNIKIQQAVNQLIADLRLTEGSDYEKVLKLNEYFCKKVEYDAAGADLADVTRVIMSHTILGVFAKRRAQCEGIAKAVKVLLNAVDVKCIVVDGTATLNDGTRSLHAWNIIKQGGVPYHVDITFNMGHTTNGNVAYDWLNVSDAMVKGNHMPDTDMKLPACRSEKLNYYTLNKAVFSSKKQACEYIKKKIKYGERLIYMRFNGRVKVSNIYMELVQIVSGAIRECYTDQDNLTVSSVLGVDTNTLRLWIR
ncbi:MAG: transglutaminase domain-containing protein [Eubacteriales bacterium]|nr:transglutaminase domain-containing protein [Eubacteriales bacterium]